MPTATLSGLSAEETQRLRSMARTALAELGVTATIHEDCLKVDDGRTFGLENLASFCNAVPEHQWPKVIREHFKALVTTYPTEPPTLTAEQIRTGACLRVVHISAVNSMGPDVADTTYSYAKRIGGDLLELLVHVEGPMVRWLRDSEVELVGLDELLHLGRAQLRRIEYDTETIPGTGLTLRIGNSGFVASQILNLAEITDPTELLLVAIPTRHQLVTAPAIEDALLQLATYVRLEHRHGQSPLSPHVYAWNNGRITQVT